jgi:uncharacterized protein (DUF3084 family)
MTEYSNNGFLFSFFMGKKCAECKAGMAREFEKVLEDKNKIQNQSRELTQKVEQLKAEIRLLENVDYEILSQIFNEKHGLNGKLESVEDRNLTAMLKEAKGRSGKNKIMGG